MNLNAMEYDPPDHPYEKANFISKWSFWWLKDFFALGLKRPIEDKDVYKTLGVHESKRLTDRVQELWEKELQKKKPSFYNVLSKIYAARILTVSVLFTIVDVLLRSAQPQCLGSLVTYFSQTADTPDNERIPINYAYLCAFGIVFCSFFSVVLSQPFILLGMQLGMRIRQSCCSLIYRKTLKLTKSVNIDGLNGEVLNLMTGDVSKFDYVLAFVHDLWKGPVEITVFGYFLYQEIGYYGFIGIGFILSFIPLQMYITKMTASYRLKNAERTGKRIRVMNEVIQGIQIIKMYAWEHSFANVVDIIRKKELAAIRGILHIRGILLSFNIISRAAIFLSLASYVYFGSIFTAKQVFIVTSYFSYLYQSMLHFWPLALTSVAEAYISVKRIEKYLLVPEKKQKSSRISNGDKEDDALLTKKLTNGSNMILNKFPTNIGTGQRRFSRTPSGTNFNNKGIIFDNATAVWSSGEDGSTGLHNITLKINSMCAVIGTVGSGKSTILQVILGELPLDNGHLIVNGTVSYASQEPWLFEGTVRQNILFTEKYDEKRYKEVIRVCALQRDMEILPHGDATIVGERGLSLSGGQRARVNLARAIYREADIYLLDDPLSAVDTHVGKHIFEKCIRDHLKDKTCVLVTHQVQYLKKVQHVVLMNMGHIEAQGSYSNVKRTHYDSIRTMTSVAEERRLTVLQEIEAIAAPKEVETIVVAAQESRKEEQITGSVGFKVYKSYFGSIESWPFVCTVALMATIGQVAISFTDLFVTKWVNWESENAKLYHPTFIVEKSLNLLLNGTDANATATTLATTATTTVTPLNATQLDAIMLQPSNSSASDLDGERHQYMYTYAIIMLLVLYLVFQRAILFFSMCLKASRKMHDKLFRGIIRAPMHFYNANSSGRIMNRFSKDISNVDTMLPMALYDSTMFVLQFSAILVLVSMSNYWLLFPTCFISLIFYTLRSIYINTARCVKRIEATSRSPILAHTNATINGLTTIRASNAQQALSDEYDKHQDVNTSAWFLFLTTSRALAIWLELVCVIYMAAVLSIFLVFADGIAGGNVGLAITQILNLIAMCQWGLRQTTELENNMTSVERVVEYTNLEPEPPLEIENKKIISSEWPSKGEIKFQNLSMRYSPKSHLTLRNLTFSIAPKEKIGIVGRTGAGKSSIIQALFRLAQNEGTIEIDGVDTATLGLHDLRKKISIIPQDPILFSGTMRENLDPFKTKSDVDLWSALEQVELKPVVCALPGGLDCKMSDGGSNFSMGQRQLVCLARAILRNNKILILDEATANVDADTDKFIQATIRDKFADCTVLTIAHRLHTVMDSDKVLVMDAGQLVEYEHAYILLRHMDGYLRKLVDEADNATANQLAEMAKQSYEKKDAYKHFTSKDLQF